MLNLAAAIERRARKSGHWHSNASANDALDVVARWAAGLHPCLMLSVLGQGAYNKPTGFCVHADIFTEVYLAPVFAAAEEFRKGLGYRLIHTLESVIHGSVDVWTPERLFDFNCHYNWHEATTQEEYIQYYREENEVDGDPDELACSGPDQFFKDLPGLPRDLLGASWAPSTRRLRPMSSRSLRRLAADETCPELISNLLVAMADGLDFKHAGYPTAYQCMSELQAEWESVDVTYFFRWSPDDSLGRSIDDAMQMTWDSGMATDAMFVFDPPWPAKESETNGPEIALLEEQFERAVAFIEGASMHIWCLDAICSAMSALE